MNINTWFNTYPRPQFKRNSFYNLNKNWILNNKSINIPFCPQSKLSKYEGNINENLKYTTTFSLPKDFYKESDRLYLNFGAVDQICTVYLNNKKIGFHEGGYLPFSIDITETYVQEENILVVDVVDTLSHDYPYGKQRKNRGGMWYTPVSGIWQSVWIEAIPQVSINNIKMTPSLKGIHIDVDTNAEEYTITIPLNEKTYKKTYNDKQIDISFNQEDIHLWDVDNPYLYTIYIDTKDDHIESYFALREITINNKNQVCLNNKPIFMHGVLDQGYFMDGIFLPETPQGYIDDILNMKELGFNTLRKHIKIEPEVFYYYCDKYGMLLMQDMVNNGGYNYFFDTVLPNIGLDKRPDTINVNQTQKNIFIKHSIDTLDYLYNHPSIIAYTIFNEGWGQFEADKLYSILKPKDPTRLYDATSGWFQQKLSDFDSLHVYFKTKELKTKKNKPIYLSECGGYTRLIDGHVFNNEKQYGYGKADSEDKLTEMIEKLYDKMVINSIKNGLCGCVYTQISDVEDEINGLYTYDRQVCKVNKERMRKIAYKINKSLGE